MGKFATETTVPAEKSRMEIEIVLQKYGANAFAYMNDGNKAMIAFQAHGRRLRFTVPLPDKKEKRFTQHSQRSSWRSATASVAEERWNQDIRQRWRALLLAIKAKLEAVEIGLSTFEDEFLAFTVLPNGQTASEWMQPQIKTAYDTGKMPPLLLTSGASE